MFAMQLEAEKVVCIAMQSIKCSPERSCFCVELMDQHWPALRFRHT